MLNFFINNRKRRIYKNIIRWKKIDSLLKMMVFCCSRGSLWKSLINLDKSTWNPRQFLLLCYSSFVLIHSFKTGFGWDTFIPCVVRINTVMRKILVKIWKYFCCRSKVLWRLCTKNPKKHTKYDCWNIICITILVK